MKVEKMSLPVVLDKDGNPVAFIFHSQNRERIIYLIRKPAEDDLIDLLESSQSFKTKRGEE